MQYMGGKARVAAEIASVIHARDGGRKTYLEPFVGGGFAFAKIAPKYPTRVAGDIMPDLALLWQAVASGWVPPATLTEDEYRELRRADPSALRAFAGFGCSFGGKWFGGYARNQRGDDFPGAAARGIEAKRVAFAGAMILQAEYMDWSPEPGWVVYCDPPYAGTTAYAGSPAWRSAPFWGWAQKAAERGAAVFVSEYAAPAGWAPIWERAIKGSLSKTENDRPVTEKLFVWEGEDG